MISFKQEVREECGNEKCVEVNKSTAMKIDVELTKIVAMGKNVSGEKKAPQDKALWHT